MHLLKFGAIIVTAVIMTACQPIVVATPSAGAGLQTLGQRITFNEAYLIKGSE